jgi:hypothetical protein
MVWQASLVLIYLVDVYLREDLTNAPLMIETESAVDIHHVIFRSCVIRLNIN